MAIYSEIVTRTSLNFLNLFTFDYFIVWLRAQYYYTGKMRTLVRISFGLIVLFIVRCFIVYVDIFIKMKNHKENDDLSEFRNIQHYFNYLIIFYVGNNSLFWLGIACLLYHIYNCTHYGLFKLVKCFPIQLEDIDIFIRHVNEDHFRMFDCFVKRYTQKQTENMVERLAQGLVIRNSCFLQLKEKIQIVKRFKVIEKA